MARIRANLPPEVVVVDDYLRVDLASRRVWVCKNGGWREVHLPPQLWRLLETLIVNAGIIVPTTRIKDRVYGKSVGDSALAVAVFKLRQKLEPDPKHPVYIEVARGIGYRFNGTLVRASAAYPTDQTDSPERSGEESAALGDDAPLKVRLMAYAEQVIEELLIEGRKVGVQTSEMKRLVRAAGQRVVERFSSVLVNE
jgi:DNA-binding winged helix-turn-helix (wHTH) protein